MASLFKEEFNQARITKMSQELSNSWPDFNQTNFLTTATHNLEQLEMKARSNQIVDALTRCLPDDFAAAVTILINALAVINPVHQDKNGAADEATSAGWNINQDNPHGLYGWLVMPCADYIAMHGNTVDNFALSMHALHAMTQRFTAEFAIRPFIEAQPTSAYAQLLQWTKDPCQHVRRLASEGSRPRLPWGMRLNNVIIDPAPSITLLTALKDDPSAYVRLSVANHLNDIAKDHPQLITVIAKNWLNELTPAHSPISIKHRHRLVKHACRTLIKQGEPKTLALFGFVPAHVEATLNVVQHSIQLGDTFEFTLSITNTLDHEQSLLVDYVIWHQKSNGSLSPKVFKWKQLNLAKNSNIMLSKTHSFKAVTTRVYYPGEQRVSIQINGEEYASHTFHILK